MNNTIPGYRLALAALLVLAAHTAYASYSVPDTQPPALSSTTALPLPARQHSSPTGSAFLRATAQSTPAERERAILREIRAGNVPGHIRALTPVQLDHNGHLATVYVTPDYLALGSDDDYVVIPMAPRTAMRIAREFGFTLPTRKLVDDIYQHSTLRLTPEPMYPGARMTSNAYYREHDRRIKAQRSRSKGSPALIAGHKKDVVLSTRLVKLPHRVAIYGWHRLDGRPIQPLSLVHGISYVDYSHGVRLVSRAALLDGREVDISQILADRELNALLSDEGPLSKQSYL